MAVAFSGSDDPTTRGANVAGVVMASETGAATAREIVVEEVMVAPEVAICALDGLTIEQETVAVPTPTAIASPALGPPLVICTTAGLDEIHVTWLVISSVPLVNVPMALNCTAWPKLVLTVVDEMAMLISAAGVTVTPVLPEILVRELKVAVTDAVPLPTAVAKPVVPMLNTAVLEEAHSTVLVTSRVLPSDRVAMAVNCWVLPMGSEVALGVTLMDVIVAAGCSFWLLPPPPQPVNRPATRKRTNKPERWTTAFTRTPPWIPVRPTLGGELRSGFGGTILCAS